MHKADCMKTPSVTFGATSLGEGGFGAECNVNICNFKKIHLDI